MTTIEGDGGAHNRTPMGVVSSGSQCLAQREVAHEGSSAGRRRELPSQTAAENLPYLLLFFLAALSLACRVYLIWKW